MEKRGVLLIQTTISSKGNPFTNQEKETIRKIKSNLLKSAGNLYCIRDSAYMVTNNEDISKGIANGTLSWLYDVILKPNATIKVKTLSSGEKVHAVEAVDVRCLIFKHRNASWSSGNIFPSLAEGCFPVIPKDRKFRWQKSKDCIQNVNLIQFPCQLSIVLTGYKVQGITCDSIILGALYHLVHYGRLGWLYVILSRVRTLEGFFVMEKIDEDPSKYLLRIDVQEEMERLQKN